MTAATQAISARPNGSGRQRVLDASYELFVRHGIQAVGVDSIVKKAGVAKATFYRNFGSKDGLAVAFLNEREERWTKAWLVSEIERRADDPVDRLLVLFEVLGEWFSSDDFESCSFVKVLLEYDDREAPARLATVRHLENIRSYLAQLASEAGVDDPDELAREWLTLIVGAMVSATAGDLRANVRAAKMARLLLADYGVRHPGS